MDVKPQLNSSQMLAGAGFAIGVILCSWLALFHESTAAPFLVGGLAVVIILVRPVLGLALYLLIYPVVPADESITPLKSFVLGLTILLLFVWVIQKMRKRERFFSQPEYMWMYLFFLFLCVSPIIGTANGFTPTDWARDIAPLLNLLLLPVMVDCFKEEKNRWLLYLLFVPIGFGIVRDMLVSAAQYGFPVAGLGTLTSLPLASIHPSLGLGLGVAMFFHKSAHRKYWLGLAVVSLAVAFLSHTRTVWIATSTMGLLIVISSAKRRLWAAMSLAVMAVLVGWMILYSPGSSGYVQAQRERFGELEHFRSDLSVQNRFDELGQTAELFQRSPLYGVGFGYKYNFWRSFITGVGPGYMRTNYTHNDIMFIASKGGVIGLILFGMMLFKFAKELNERRNEELGSTKSAWATFGVMAVLNSLIIGMSTPFYQSRWDMFIFVALLAMGLGYKEDGTAKPA